MAMALWMARARAMAIKRWIGGPGRAAQRARNAADRSLPPARSAAAAPDGAQGQLTSTNRAENAADRPPRSAAAAADGTFSAQGAQEQPSSIQPAKNAADRSVLPPKSPADGIFPTQGLAQLAVPANLDPENAFDTLRGETPMSARRWLWFLESTHRPPAAFSTHKGFSTGTRAFTTAAARNGRLHAPIEMAGFSSGAGKPGNKPSLWTAARDELVVWWALKFMPTEDPVWRLTDTDAFNPGVSTSKMLSDISLAVKLGQKKGAADETSDTFLTQFCENGRQISEQMLMEMHKVICENHKPELGLPGCLREEEHVEPSNIEEMFKIAAIFYARFVCRIHPFGDQNGKAGMMVVSVILRKTLGFYVRWLDPWPDDHHARISPEHAVLLWCAEKTCAARKRPRDLCAWLIEAAWTDFKMMELTRMSK